MKRFYDKSVYCRANAIKACAKLVMDERNILERAWYRELLKLTFGRMKDESANVRKNALQLFAHIIDKYAQMFNTQQFLTLAELDEHMAQTS